MNDNRQIRLAGEPKLNQLNRGGFMQPKDYKAEMRKTLEEWDAKIHDLRTRAEKLPSEKREEMMREIEAIVEKKQAIEERMEKAEQSGIDNWEELRDGLQHAAKDLQSSLDSAMSK
jgi:predicted nuclease with TOPRIM domain